MKVVINNTQILFKMEEKTLFKLAIVTSLIGLFIMIIMAENLNAPDISAAAIDKGMISKNVKLTGTLASKKDFKSLVIFNVTDSSGSINVIIYKKSGKFGSSGFRKGDLLEIEGFVKEYNKMLEIEANYIKKIEP